LECEAPETASTMYAIRLMVTDSKPCGRSAVDEYGIDIICVG
jgi:hypothetical protein